MGTTSDLFETETGAVIQKVPDYITPHVDSHQCPLHLVGMCMASSVCVCVYMIVLDWVLVKLSFFSFQVLTMC